MTDIHQEPFIRRANRPGIWRREVDGTYTPWYEPERAWSPGVGGWTFAEIWERGSCPVVPASNPEVPDSVELDESSVFETKSSGVRTKFSGGGVRDAEAGKPRFDLLRPVTVPYEHQLLTRFAALMARGAQKYAARNWEQFSDQSALDRAKSSAARHFEQWFNDEVDEDHAAAVVFNIMATEYVRGVLAGRWPALEAE